MNPNLSMNKINYSKYHCTYTALLEKTNVQGVQLNIQFMPRLLNTSQYNVLLENEGSMHYVSLFLIEHNSELFNNCGMNRPFSGALCTLFFPNRAVYVQ